ncbi:hypothetical protein AMS68_001723 [Peltaster fructicola]|uniref:FAS1 domain-containing protein n=1 Tax=Peltaster fructicola TaxID=286661 RepID=A0A6H0XNC8_9PEZI|nr:hypothetical protein AMS68_001723 [Peltaster fructicola]
MKGFLRSIAIVSVLSVSATAAQLLPLQHKPIMESTAQVQGSIFISDILGSQKPISIFASFTRDVTAISSRLESQNTNTTLLAPLNSAISALPRKPWEDPKDYDRLGEQAYLGSGGSERAAQNLERFVNAHVVPVSPWQEGDKVTTLAGREIWWETRDGDMIVMPDGVAVEKVAKQVGNGEVWILKNVVNYAS